MLPPIPNVADYGVSLETGFLPAELPLQRLPHPAYDKWERIMSNFQSLLLSKRIRGVVDTLPVMPTAHLDTEPEWRRAYSILAFIAHGYIWGGEKPAEVWIFVYRIVLPLLTLIPAPATFNNLPTSLLRRASRHPSRCHIRWSLLVELQTYFPVRTHNLHRKPFDIGNLHRLAGRAMVLLSISHYGSEGRPRHTNDVARDGSSSSKR